MKHIDKNSNGEYYIFDDEINKITFKTKNSRYLMGHVMSFPDHYGIRCTIELKGN